jgi:hypothetical protein
MSDRVPVHITLVEGGSLTFLGEPFESGDRTAVYTGQETALVKIPGKPDGFYALIAPATIPNEGLLEIQLLPGADFQGRVRIKVLNDTVVGWVPLTDVYHARRLEFPPAEITGISAEGPLKEPPEKTVLDWVLGDDPF